MSPIETCPPQFRVGMDYEPAGELSHVCAWCWATGFSVAGSVAEGWVRIEKQLAEGSFQIKYACPRCAPTEIPNE